MTILVLVIAEGSGVKRGSASDINVQGRPKAARVRTAKF